MILADTDILSAMAKIARLPLLLVLFRTTELRVTPGVFAELEYGFDLGRQYAKTVFALLTAQQIQIVYLTESEATFRNTLPLTLGTGERESIAVAKERGGIVLSNESRVHHYCRQYDVPCVRLPDILRALWKEGILAKDEIPKMIADLQTEDRMQFKQSVVDAILAD